MSNNIEVHKRSAFIAMRLIETLKRLGLAHPMVGFHGKHREDNIIKIWKYGKAFGSR